jgi:hypothetical protein
MAAQAPQPTTVRDILAIIGKLNEGFKEIQKRRSVFDDSFQRYEWARNRVPELEDLQDRYENIQRAVQRGLDITINTWRDLKNLTRPDAQGRRRMNIDDILSQVDLDTYTRFIKRQEANLSILETVEREIEQALILIIKSIDARSGPLVSMSAPDQEQPPPPPPPDADIRNRSMYGFGMPGAQPHMRRGEYWHAGVNRR